MTDFGFILLLLGAFLAYRYYIKPRFLSPPKQDKKIHIDSKPGKKDFDDGELIDYEEIKE